MIATENGSDLQEVAASGLIDMAWYRANHPDLAQLANLELLAHYFAYGWREGRKPNPYFDGSWYLAQHTDIGSAGMDPLLHYIRHGDLEGRRPCPYFDPAAYRAGYKLQPGELALKDFLLRRHTGQVAPTPELWAVMYLSPWRELVQRGVDPFLAYLQADGREDGLASPDESVINASGLLDPNYYLINGSDVQEAALDPVEHFCRFGWREGRKPNIYFDMEWYRATNPQVGRLRLNPLVHYVLAGEPAGRRPVAYFDPEWYRTEYGIPPGRSMLAHYLAHRRTQRYSPNPLFDVGWYVQRYGEDVGPNRDPFAHYLHSGTFTDVRPSPTFNAAEYRRQKLGRPSRRFPHLMHPEHHNPLVHFLRANYR